MSGLAARTTQDAAAASLVLVPVGSLEQHGPHLPLGTDAVIAEAVACGVARRLGADVAPALPYGSSGEHQTFAGTTSIGTSVLRAVAIELVRSMASWASRIVFVNGHGGNLAALRAAVDQLVAEGHSVELALCGIADGDAHAGRTETSLMLHLRPGEVRLDQAQPGNTRPLHELLPAMIEGGLAAVSPNGVLGDPLGASAAEGTWILQQMIQRVCDELEGES